MATITRADKGKYMRFTSTGAKTCLFVSTNNYQANDEYHITNRSVSGDLVISGTGVTLNPPKGGTLILEVGDIVTVKFVTATQADVFGSTKALV